VRPKRELRELIARLAPVVWPALREEYTPDCCIAAAAILKRVFALYGYASEAMPVTVRIYNAAMLKLISNGRPLPDDHAALQRLFNLTGAWGLGILPESARTDIPITFASERAALGGRFGGHLVLRVREYIIDAALGQADRPHKQIHIPSLICGQVFPEFMAGNAPLELNVRGCMVSYGRLNDYTFRSAPDWRRRATPFPETVHKIIERIEGGAPGPALEIAGVLDASV
jgi:hypothetical protein